MAVTSGAIYTHTDSTDITTGARKRICEEIIYSQDPRDLPLRDYFGGYEKLPVKSTKIEHVEDNHVAIDGAQGASDVSQWDANGEITGLEVTDASIFSGGDIVLTTTGEIVIVGWGTDSVDESLNELDVLARGDLGTTESNSNTTSSLLMIIGNAQLEGFTYGNYPRFATKISKVNYSQIFTDDISVTKSYQKIPKFGIKDEVAHQLKNVQLRQAKLLERAVIYGGANVDTLEGGASNPRTMYGLLATSAVAAAINIQANTTSLGDAEVTEADVKAEMQAIYGEGGNPDTLICNAFNKGVISDWMLPYRRTDMEDTRYNQVVNTYATDFGTVNIIIDRYMRASDIIILDKKNFSIGAYRPFEVIQLPNTKDSHRATVVGEYTCMLRNEEHSAWLYSSSTS